MQRDTSSTDANVIRPEVSTRRSFLARTGTAMLSGAAIALMAGADSKSIFGTAQASEGDVAILNSALSAEREAVAAYQLAAESGLLGEGALKLGVTFQDHHKQHADALAATISKLGGAADTAPSQYDFPTDQLTDERAVLAFAAELEKGAVSAYLGAVPILGDRELAKVAASILGDEAMHWAVLRSALGQDPVPVAFMS